MCSEPAQTILIVDDEVSYRLMLRALLEKKGFKVIEAEDGEAGVALAEERRPDLILMDVNMPRLKGSEAVRILKEGEICRNTPIIVVSGREDSDDLLECRSVQRLWLRFPTSRTTRIRFCLQSKPGIP